MAAPALPPCLTPAFISPLLVLLFFFVSGVAGDDSAVFNVRTFGALGDGTTDDTVAIQLAIDTAANATVAYMFMGPLDHSVLPRALQCFSRGGTTC